MKAGDFIFYTDSKNTKYGIGEKPVSTQSVDQFFRKEFDWIGVEGVSTHNFRRTRLTQLHIKEQWSLKEIMDISGDKNLLSLQQYLDLDRRQSFDKYRKFFEKEGV